MSQTLSWSVNFPPFTKPEGFCYHNPTSCQQSLISTKRVQTSSSQPIQYYHPFYLFKRQKGFYTPHAIQPKLRCADTWTLRKRSQKHLEKNWNVMLEKSGDQLDRSCAIWRFITALTSAHQLSLSSVKSIKSVPPNPTYRRYILILSSHLRPRFPSRLFPSGLTTKTLYASLLHPIWANMVVKVI